MKQLRVKYLNISNNPIGNSGIVSLVQLPELITIEAVYCGISHEGLSKMKTLEIIRFKSSMRIHLEPNFSEQHNDLITKEQLILFYPHFNNQLIPFVLHDETFSVEHTHPILYMPHQERIILKTGKVLFNRNEFASTFSNVHNNPSLIFTKENENPLDEERLVLFVKRFLNWKVVSVSIAEQDLKDGHLDRVKIEQV